MYGMWLVGFLNALSGLGQGPLYPGSSGLFAAWLPDSESALYIAIVYAMWSGGQAISNALQPTIMTNLGWEWCYYIFAGFVLVWVYSWDLYGYDRPADDPHCSAHEKAWIGKQDAGMKQEDGAGGFDMKLYWAVCKQKPVASYIVLNILLASTQAVTATTRFPGSFLPEREGACDCRGGARATAHGCRSICSRRAASASR